MLRKTVEFSTPGTRLSVAHRQLVIQRPDLPKATLPIEDLGVVIVDDVRATYTQAVFLELLEAGAIVLVTGRDHLPIGMMLPLDAHHAQAERHRAQVQASEPIRKQAWQAIVRAKISQQAMVLAQFSKGLGQFGNHLVVEGVAHLGAVQGDRGDHPGLNDQCGHVFKPLKVSSTSKSASRCSSI